MNEIEKSLMELDQAAKILAIKMELTWWIGLIAAGFIISACVKFLFFNKKSKIEIQKYEEDIFMTKLQSMMRKEIRDEKIRNS